MANNFHNSQISTATYTNAVETAKTINNNPDSSIPLGDQYDFNELKNAKGLGSLNDIEAAKELRKIYIRKAK